MKPLRETHGTVFELVRHFLAGIFDSEMFTARGQWRPVAIGIVSTLLPAGMALLDQRYAARYHRLSGLPWPEPFREALAADETGLLTLLFSISGLAAMLQWQMLLPERRDYLALASLPIRPREVFTARFLTVLIAAAIFVVALNGLPSLLAPMVFNGRWLENQDYWTNAAAWLTASALTCAFALSGSVALQGALLNLLPARLYPPVSSWTQGTFGALFFLAVIVSFRLTDWPQKAAAELRELQWAPPVWFAGLLRTMTGSRDPFLHTMARRALTASAISALLALFAYFASYRRYRTLLLEAPDAAGRAARSRWSLASVLARDPRRRAIFDFMTQTLARSRTHRLLALAYSGFAAGILINSALIAYAAAGARTRFGETLAFAALYWPIAASMIAIAGLRHVFSLPVELRANWLFCISESQGRAEWMSAVERFILVFGIAPIYAVLAPLAIHVLGWAVALRMIVLQALISLIVFEMLFQSWQQLPFACSYAPGQKPLMSILGKYFGALAFLAPALAILLAPVCQLNSMFICALFLLSACWLRMRALRKQGWGEAQLMYEDAPDALADLGLRE